MKKIISVLLALVMTLALSVSALAAGEGSITVDNAVNGKTYTIYRIFDLNSHSDDYKAINYKVSAKWSAFFDEGADGLKYVDIDNQGYVTWKKDASAPEFAAAAIAFAEAKGIANDGQKKAAGNTLTFTGLDLGYYLVKSDLGALCSLDTTMPNVTIKEKNGVPTVDKKVKEGEAWGKTNDANIGDTVNFQTTINVIDGQPKNYVLHDKMSAGLTFNGTVEVTVNGEKITSGYELKNPGTDGCTFDVVFANGTLKPNDVVTVSYSATLNDKAVIAGTGNPNDTKLSYTDTNNKSHETVPSVTHTYTWQVDVYKYTTKDNNETALAGAQFVLYKTVNNVKYYAVVDDNNKITGWTTEGVKPDENADESKTYASVFTTPASGKFTITGLDSDTYYLEEIVAPAGYNMLKDPITVTVKDDGTVTYGNNITATPDVKVLNQSGTELPSTGGIGTTIFYVLGGVLMAGAFVLLVVRKRMRAE